MNTPNDDLDFGQTIRGFTEGRKVFGRFLLRRVVGRGGMGVVWLAWDEKLEEDVAIKFMPEMVRLDEAGLRELKRETRKSLQLTHPHIVRIRDFVEDAQTAGIVMEYVDGPTLSVMRLHQPGEVFSPDQLRGAIIQLLGALIYAHEVEGVVHRDLKPANLMVNSRSQLKVADFGISGSITDSVSRMSARMGTSGSPPYMSPQQVMGESSQATDDIYSVGATIYELLTGKPPFHRGNIHEQIKEKVPPAMAQRRRALGVEANEEIPAVWETLVARCLAKNPVERPQSARQMLDWLEGRNEVAEPSRVAALMQDPTSSSRRLRPTGSSVLSKPWAILAAVAGLLLIVAGGFHFIPKGTKTAQAAAQTPATGVNQESVTDRQQAETANPESRIKQGESQNADSGAVHNDAPPPPSNELVAVTFESPSHRVPFQIFPDTPPARDASRDLDRLRSLFASNAVGPVVLIRGNKGLEILSVTSGVTPARIALKPGRYFAVFTEPDNARQTIDLNLQSLQPETITWRPEAGKKIPVDVLARAAELNAQARDQSESNLLYEASENADLAAILSGTTEMNLLVRAHIASRLRDFEKLQKLSEQLLLQDPENQNAMFNLAESYFVRHDYSKAGELFQSLSQHDSFSSKDVVWFKVFLCDLQLGKAPDPSKFLELSGVTNSSVMEMWMQAAVLFHNGQSEKAREIVDSARKESSSPNTAVFLDSFIEIGWLSS